MGLLQRCFSLYPLNGGFQLHGSAFKQFQHLNIDHVFSGVSDMDIAIDIIFQVKRNQADGFKSGFIKQSNNICVTFFRVRI